MRQRFSFWSPSQLSSRTASLASREVQGEFTVRRFSAKVDDKSEQPRQHDGGKPLSTTAKAKQGIRELWQKYGMVFLTTYGSLYLVTLGGVYQLVRLKIIDTESALLYLHSSGLDRVVDVTPLATSTAGTFALAWLLTKFTEPLRLAVTVSITPGIAKLVRKSHKVVEKLEKESSKHM